MVLLWCDGFDHYGTSSTGRANMLDGPYAEVGSAATPDTTNPRTGANACRMNTSSPTELRRVFGADKSTVGVGYAYYTTELPNADYVRFTLAKFSDNGLSAQVSFYCTTTGQIECRTGSSSGTVIGTSAVVLTAAAYQHLEFKVTIHSTTGSAEARVNGVTVLNLTNVDTRSSGDAQTAQVQIGIASTLGNGQGIVYIDDLYAWDDTGTSANDFLGDRRVITLYPNGDTAQTGWVRSTGSTASNDYEHIDESGTGGPDDDTTYLYSTSSTGGGLSDFDFENMPANVSSITAVQIVGYMRKTDAGVCDVKMSMVSSTDIASGSTHNITEVYTYYNDIFHTDPATGAAWTSTAVDSAKIRFIRTV